MRDYRTILAHQATLGHTICLGLDPDISKIPAFISSLAKTDIEAVYPFLVNIIGATSDLVQAYKPNFAFFEQFGGEGFDALMDLTDFIKKENPNVLTIGDAKRGDIGNTNDAYMKVLSKFDAFTIHPYLGGTANMPFLADKNKLVFVLCSTSNDGADEFQDLYTMDFNPNDMPDGISLLSWLAKISRESMPLYQRVAKNSMQWGENVGLVAGANDLGKIAKIREIIGDNRQLLIPGVGAQGGDLEESYKAGRNSFGLGVTINLSRSILYKSSGGDFSEVARNEVIRLNKIIQECHSQDIGGF